MRVQRAHLAIQSRDSLKCVCAAWFSAFMLLLLLASPIVQIESMPADVVMRQQIEAVV